MSTNAQLLSKCERSLSEEERQWQEQEPRANFKAMFKECSDWIWETALAAYFSNGMNQPSTMVKSPATPKSKAAVETPMLSWPKCANRW